MKSSKDKVNAIKVPETIPGKIQKSVTLKNAFMGVHPKSFAAYFKQGSILWSLGKTDKTTVGMQIVVCAKTKVKRPSLNNFINLKRETNNTIKEIPDIISGLTIDILFKFKKSLLDFFLNLSIPMAAKVPIIAANNDATIATKKVFKRANTMSSSCKSISYHLKEKPEKTALLLELLKENITKIKIGKYKKAKTKKKYTLLNIFI